MNQQEPQILPIAELPAPKQENFRRIQAAIQTNDPLTARDLMGEILEYYVNIDREIPNEVEVAYARLLVLENPELDYGKLTRIAGGSAEESA